MARLMDYKIRPVSILISKNTKTLIILIICYRGLYGSKINKNKNGNYS